MMKYWFLLISILLVLSGCGVKTLQTPVEESLNTFPQYSGTLVGATEWKGAVVIAGDVRIPVGSRLVIHPGTRVYVRAAQGTKIDPEYLSSATELLVQGEIRINGSQASPVAFLPIDVPPEAEYGWAGIELIGARKSQISGVVLSRADTGILCVDSSPLIRDNRITRCRYGVIVQHNSSPVMVNNQIQDGEGGIFCWRASHPVLTDNQIIGHAEEGLHIDSDSRPQLGRNVVSHNDIGIYLGSKNIDISNIQFRQNRVDTHLSWAIIDQVDES